MSPEEILGQASDDDPWPALSFRLGLLLHCMAQRITNYPALLSDIAQACLRESGHGGVPDRGVVEASLAVLAIQAQLVCAHPRR
mmetsp:Transcript_14648/g.40199  ORF Transcript_14648/g.40199 Transcript_14648/m.40199 type:complete len:84 (+) Transcript_14648:429-680(+)